MCKFVLILNTAATSNAVYIQIDMYIYIYIIYMYRVHVRFKTPI